MTTVSYDLTLKALIDHRHSDFLRKLCGQNVIELVSAEVGRSVRRATDAIAILEDGSLVQVEFQSTNDTNIAWRMLEYNVEIVRRYHNRLLKQGVKATFPPVLRQIVIYVGRGKSTMRNIAAFNEVKISYEVYGIRGMFDNGAELLESNHYRDWILAVLCMAPGDDEFGRRSMEAELRRIARELSNLPKAMQQELYALLEVVAGRRGLTKELNSEIQAMSFDVDAYRESTILRGAVDHGVVQGIIQAIWLQLESAGQDNELDDYIESCLASYSPDELKNLARWLRRDGREEVVASFRLRKETHPQA